MKSVAFLLKEVLLLPQQWRIARLERGLHRTNQLLQQQYQTFLSLMVANAPETQEALALLPERWEDLSEEQQEAFLAMWKQAIAAAQQQKEKRT